MSSSALRTVADSDILAGRLVVEVVVTDDVITQVGVRSSRPQLAARLLRGQLAALAADAVPRLYSLCAGAHEVAAQRARQAALGIDIDAPQTSAWSRRLESEIARESLWRALIDWPQALGETPDSAALAALRAVQIAGVARTGTVLLRQIVERHVLGERADLWWGSRRVADFSAWMMHAETPAARFLALLGQEYSPIPAYSPALVAPGLGVAPRVCVPASDTALLPSLAEHRVAAAIGASLRADPAFAQLPLWQGAPAQTGALARLHAEPRIAALRAAEGASPRLRWSARLIELARIAVGAPAAQPLHGALALTAADGQRCGLGWAESARGVLAHCLWIDDAAEARVTDYRVLAPTEWNFHPSGVLATTLTGQRADAPEALRERAQRLIDALDPCVACTLHVREEAEIA